MQIVLSFAHMKKHAALFALAACVILATAVPVLYAMRSTVGFWQGVPPSAENYYYSRLREIKDGYPFIGNPYFFEHRNEVSPAFFVADWIAAVPLLLGAPLIQTIVLNLFVWALINTLLFYLFLRVLGCSRRWSAFGGFIVLLTTYADILRPVSLQVIAPTPVQLKLPQRSLFFDVVIGFWENKLRNELNHGLFVEEGYAQYL